MQAKIEMVTVVWWHHIMEDPDNITVVMLAVAIEPLKLCLLGAK